ncbi:MAG: sugar phosphate nucleotidyltransferase [Candidatus Nanohaloarchaea archaeon]
MKAVIPVAVKKDSMFPFCESKPTGLMPVMGKPLVKHLINALQEVGVDDIYLVTNHLEQEFEEEFGEYTNVNIVHQDELSGTARAIECCDFIDEEFIAVNGDVLVSENDLQALEQKYRNSDCEAAMLATNEDRPEKFGVLSITNDRVSSIEEKPEDAQNTLVNTGIYMFSPAIFDYIDRLGEDQTSITDAVNLVAQEASARFELVEDYWLDIGTPRKLWKADRLKREHHIDSREVHDGAEISGKAELPDEVKVEEGAEIKAGAALEGRCYIGENAVVGPNTTVRDSSITAGCDLRSCDVDSSLLFEDSFIDASVSMTRSVVGEEVEIRPGTVIRESYIGPRSFVEMNNSVRGTQFVPDARTDLGEISK